MALLVATPSVLLLAVVVVAAAVAAAAAAACACSSPSFDGSYPSSSPPHHVPTFTTLPARLTNCLSPLTHFLHFLETSRELAGYAGGKTLTILTGGLTGGPNAIMAATATGARPEGRIDLPARAAWAVWESSPFFARCPGAAKARGAPLLLPLSTVVAGGREGPWTLLGRPSVDGSGEPDMAEKGEPRRESSKLFGVPVYDQGARQHPVPRNFCALHSPSATGVVSGSVYLGLSPIFSPFLQPLPGPEAPLALAPTLLFAGGNASISSAVIFSSSARRADRFCLAISFIAGELRSSPAARPAAVDDEGVPPRLTSSSSPEASSSSDSSATERARGDGH